MGLRRIGSVAGIIGGLLWLLRFGAEVGGLAADSTPVLALHWGGYALIGVMVLLWGIEISRPGPLWLKVVIALAATAGVVAGIEWVRQLLGERDGAGAVGALVMLICVIHYFSGSRVRREQRDARHSMPPSGAGRHAAG